MQLLDQRDSHTRFALREHYTRYAGAIATSIVLTSYMQHARYFDRT
jgi:hypothetical protein